MARALLEVFLFDFAGDLYGTDLDVAFIAWIRPEMRFDSVEALVRRMDDDSRRARASAGARRPTPSRALGVSGPERPRPRSAIRSCCSTAP